MDNMKPLIDAVSEDRREEAATDDEAGRPDCHGARQGGQRGSSCGRHGRSGPPPWVGMMSHMGPPCGSSWGPSCGQSSGPPYGPSGMSPCGPPCRPPCRSSCGPPYGHPGGPPFMHGSSGFGPVQCPLGRGPPFMNGPPQCACPWDRGMAPMNDFGPMACPWGTHPPWADETVDDENDKKHAGKQNAKDAGEETHDPQQKDGADCEKSGQQCPGCPWGDGMRRRRMRHANVDCRRHDPYPMSVNCRCRRRCGARSHCPPWSTVPGDCCQPGAPMGWSGCPYPLPFFGPFACDSAGESNSDPENDNQKQDGDQETPKAFCPFSQGPTGFGDRWRPCCHDNGRGWQCGPPRNKLYEMLSWKRKVLKEKLQRIESHLERLRPSEEETKEAATGEDAGPEQASSMSTAPEAASPMDTHGGETGERGWEVIDDSE